MQRKILIPGYFRKFILKLRGEKGKIWLDNLPKIIEDCRKRYNLDLEQPFPNLSINFTIPAKSHYGTQVVLKLSLPGDKEFLSEVEALKLFNGEGAVRIIDFDLKKGILILERLIPGKPLKDLNDEEKEISIAANLMKKLWKKVSKNHNFLTVKERHKAFERLRKKYNGGTGPLPADLIEKAEEILKELSSSMGEEVLLHGDLHHDNILSSQRGYLAIDPKGIIGEREYEIGAYLFNPMFELLKKINPKNILRKRVDKFSDELGFDKERIRLWGFYQAILSAVWSVEDVGYGYKTVVEIAQILDEINYKNWC